MARTGEGLRLKGRTWYLDFTYRGERHIMRLGSGISKTLAREIAGQKRAAILRGEAGLNRKRRDLTIEEAGKLFIQWSEANRKPGTTKFYRACVEQLKAGFAGRKLSQIQPFLIEKYRQERLKEGTAGKRTTGGRVATNRELATLKAIFNRMLEWRKFEGANPVKAVRLSRESRGRERALDPEEETALLAHASEPLRTIILVGIYAGLRIKSEALTLRRRDVDLKAGTLTVTAAYAKNQENRTIPLNSILRAALGRIMRESASEYVFARPDGSPYRSIRTAFETARRHARLESDVTPHVLRHTFASKLVMAGVDLRTVQILGGWKNLAMVERYSQISPKHKAEAVELIASHSTPLSRQAENDASSESVKSLTVNKIAGVAQR